MMRRLYNHYLEYKRMTAIRMNRPHEVSLPRVRLSAQISPILVARVGLALDACVDR